MRMIRLLSVVLVAFSALAVETSAQVRGNSQAFHIRVPQTVEKKDLMIWYFLTGPFGGYGSTVAGKQDVSDYAIELSVNKKLAETLKAIVYCPGYQIATINASPLSALKEKVEEVELRPAASVSLTGKVMWPARLSTENFKVYIKYEADWEHEFFGISDGMVAMFDIAEVGLAKDGSFSVTLPDFTLDPAVNDFQMPGEFTFTIQDPKTGKLMYKLEPAENRGGYGLQIAPQYLYGLIFYPRLIEWKSS